MGKRSATSCRGRPQHDFLLLHCRTLCCSRKHGFKKNMYKLLERSAQTGFCWREWNIQLALNRSIKLFKIISVMPLIPAVHINASMNLLTIRFSQCRVNYLSNHRDTTYKHMWILPKRYISCIHKYLWLH